MTTLLDTDVLIEVQRRTPGALTWIENEFGSQASIPSAVALEMLTGSRNKIELERADRFLRGFDVLEFAAGDFKVAYELVLEHQLNSGLSLPDFLIAAQALNRGALLYTFNLKHFQVISTLKIKAPFERTIT